MTKENDIMVNEQQETLLFQDACTIIEQAQEEAYRQVNVTLIKRNWLLGMRIQHEVLKDKRAEYGEQVVKNLAEGLMQRYGKGFTWRNLYNYIDFYTKHGTLFYQSGNINLASSEILHAVSAKSSEDLEGNIVNAVSSQSGITPDNILHAVSGKSENIFQSLTGKYPIRLSWTHYRIILQENSKEARDWYEQEAAREMWGTRTLQRNVSSQYYHRLLKSQNKALVHDEMVKLTSPLQDRLEHLKNPVVAEFLGFKNRTDYTESELEQTIIDHLIPFLMEMGRGFCFEYRQKRILIDQDYFKADLIFYHRILKCHVIIDLKIDRFRHEYASQLNLYMNYYRHEVMQEDDNPPIGLLLCTDYGETTVQYATEGLSQNLFVSKYRLQLPSEDDIRKYMLENITEQDFEEMKKDMEK